MSLAIAVMIAASSVRSSARRPAARRSATASIASVAEPPLPRASSLPPAVHHLRAAAGAPVPEGDQLPAGREPLAQRRRGQHERVGTVLERLCAQLADLLRLH